MEIKTNCIIKQILNDSDINLVVDLAKEIWRLHFVPIIGSKQVEYMLNNFQSFNAIKSQIKSGYEYYLVINKNKLAGYFGIILDINENKLMISKIYIKKSMRKKGIGTVILNFIEHKTSLLKITTIWLTVNRYNKDSINWYKSKGFKITKEEKKNIGKGFFMDDYIMEKNI